MFLETVNELALEKMSVGDTVVYISSKIYDEEIEVFGDAVFPTVSQFEPSLESFSASDRLMIFIDWSVPVGDCAALREILRNYNSEILYMNI
jgi:hypothetical protein